MAKSKVACTKAKPSKSNGQSMSVPDPWSYHALGLTHCALTAPYQYTKNDELSGRSRDGSLELYTGLHPKNALESVLSRAHSDFSDSWRDSQIARTVRVLYSLGDGGRPWRGLTARICVIV